MNPEPLSHLPVHRHGRAAQAAAVKLAASGTVTWSSAGLTVIMGATLMVTLAELPALHPEALVTVRPSVTLPRPPPCT